MDDHHEQPTPDPADKPTHGIRRVLPLLVITLAILVASLGYRILNDVGLEQTSLLFIGVPAMLAAVLGSFPPARSSIGMVMKGTTLALLLSMVALGEGGVCVVMAAPIFYAVAALVTVVVRLVRNRLKCAVLLPFALMAMEGTTQGLSGTRRTTVTASRATAASPQAVECQLESSPVLGGELPAFLRLGFPQPTSIQAQGINVGDRWVVGFVASDGRAGDLTLEVAQRGQGLLRLSVVQDNSKIAHWMSWREAVVTWVEDGVGGTNITWSLTYDRELDPSWYFAPLERYGAHLAAEYLLNNLAVPPHAL